MRERVESGIEKLEEYGGPLLERYGRTALVIGVAVVAVAGVALIVSRRRRRRTLADRLQGAVPEVKSRLRSAADRLSR